MKELLLGLVGAAVVAAAFMLGRTSAVPERAAEQKAAVAQTFDPGQDGSVSVYNPDGRLLKFYGVRGAIEKLPSGEIVFEATDGRRVRTNATYIIEGQAAPK